MNILVTGGAGFIGVNFLHRFVTKHLEHRFINADTLTYAANPLSIASLAEEPNYVFERCDIAEPAEVDAVFERQAVDAVVHFAAESHVDRSILGPGEFVRTNVQGTFTLLEACRRHWQGATEGRVFHHVSTDEVYGSLGETGLFTETTAYDPSSPYSASKAASDHLVRAWGRTYGLPFRITNCSNNYGPYQFPEKLVPLMILNAHSDVALPIYGTGQNVRDWLFVEDHCDAIWAVLTRGVDGETYNVGGRNEIRNVDVVDAICRVVAEETGRDVEALLGLKAFVKDRPGHDHRYAIDAGKIERELGWTPKETFDTGLRRTVRWYLDHPDWVDSVRSGAYRTWIEQNYGER
ncbi:MAG: dTDP-glucose 4,6-dehydratase [Sandaracinaceae bacterium]